VFTLEAAKRSFFDRDGIANKLDAGIKRSLSKLGAFVRQRAKTSIRKRQGISRPGSPPFSHTDVLRRGILFGFDQARQSVVIGPVLMGSRSGAPERLEHGGAGVVGGRERRVAVYRPRPFMVPALDAELPRAPQLFKGLIR